MRTLQTRDLFAFVRMIDEVGIKDKLKELIMSKDNLSEITAESFGYDLIFTLMEGASTKKAENAIYEFFGGIMEKDTEEVASMEALDFVEAIFQIADVEKWKNFFTSAAKLMK